MDYTYFTTFRQDFSIADLFGIAAIKDTFRRAFKEWRSHYDYLTELVLVLNDKCWEHFHAGNFDYSELYAKLYYEALDYAYANLTGEELAYFRRTTD
jgi:hypothetical protein